MFICLAGCLAHAPYDTNAGAGYLGAKYLLDPLGEGSGYDSDPLIRFDAFDCTTFVETVIANGDVARLNRIRYKDGDIDFLKRNHFIETDWLENNSDLLENVSYKYASTELRHVIVDKSSWLKKVHNIDYRIPSSETYLEYIPYINLRPITNNSPLIVLFISGKSEKSDNIGTDIAVVHMGILLPGGKVMRHASSSAGCVVDVEFAKYVKQRQNGNVIGIALVEVK